MDNANQEKKKDLKEFWRAFKFTIISISAGLVQTGAYAVCHELIKLNHWVASAIGLILSVIWNFTINRKITFKSVSNLKIAMLQVAGFYAIFGPLVIYLNYLGEGMANGYLLLGATMIVNLVLEYLFMRLVVYRKTCDTAIKKEEKVENDGKKETPTTNEIENVEGEVNEHEEKEEGVTV